MTPYAETFVPELRDDIARIDVGLEAVVWSPIRAEAVPLDPVATVMLEVIDGAATIDDLVADVHDVVGAPLDAARTQVARVVDLFEQAGLLRTSPGRQSADDMRDVFISPVSSCMESSSCTGKVTSVNLEIGGRQVRVACESRRTARRLRSAMKDHLIDERAPLGFMLRSSRRARRHVLVDRGGFVLGAARRTDEAVAMVCAHLSALAPVGRGRIRLRARTLVKEDRASLLIWPLLFVRAPSETELAEADCALVDTLAVDLTPDGRAFLPDPLLRTVDQPSSAPGHIARRDEPMHIDALALPRPSGHPDATAAQATAAVAGELIGCSEADALTVAAALVNSPNVRVRSVDPMQSVPELRDT